jgi:hypothetical protein
MLKDVSSASSAGNFQFFENFRSTLQHVASLILGRQNLIRIKPALF